MVLRGHRAAAGTPGRGGGGLYPPTLLGQILFIAGIANIVLGVFNCIPCPPLDGAAVLERFLPARMLPQYYNLQPFLMFLPFILILFFRNQWSQLIATSSAGGRVCWGESGPLAAAARRWGPYALAGALLLLDFVLVARGLSHAPDGGAYAALGPRPQRLQRRHPARSGPLHPRWPGGPSAALPARPHRVPVLLGFALWLPTWLPGGPASWLAATGVLTAAATFGSIALLRRHHPASAWWIAASPALLLDAGINWDLIGVVFLVAGVVWFGERRYRLSGASTAAGTCFKLFPVVVAPMALAALGARWWLSLGHRSDGPAEHGRPGRGAGRRTRPGPWPTG